jgi:hypothetical protein
MIVSDKHFGLLQCYYVVLGFFNKSSFLTPALSVTKLTNVIGMIEVPLKSDIDVQPTHLRVTLKIFGDSEF